MKSYNTLTEAVADLKKRGYTEDFNLSPECVACAALDLKIHPEDFTVDEFHRFEGMSSTDDNAIIFAISSKSGVKGTLVDAYGAYADNLNEAMIQKLAVRQ